MASMHAGARVLLVPMVPLLLTLAMTGASANEASGPKPPTPPQVPTAPAPTPAKVAGTDNATAKKATDAKTPANEPKDAAAAPAGAAPAPPPAPVAPPGPAPEPTAAERAPAPEPRSRRSARAPQKDPSPPSLTLEALRTEISNSPAEIEKNNLLQEREKLNELVSALDVAQKQLRNDTERLSAYLEDVKKQSEEKRTKEDEKKTAESLAAQQAVPNKTDPPGPSPIEVLSKAMRGMKPAQAAAIAERVPLSLAADVMQKMPARDAGRVMGLMEPARAAELAAEIASRDEARKKGMR